MTDHAKTSIAVLPAGELEPREEQGKRMGRPRIFENVDAMRASFQSYVAECRGDDRPLTISGWAAFIGCGTNSLSAYYKHGGYKEGRFERHDPEIAQFYEYALAVVEADKLEKALVGKYNATITIFDLKNNHGWSDKQEIDHTTAGRPIVVSDSESKL